MNWLYYIPHVWDSPDDRTVWEDVWLLPLVPRPVDTHSSIWLTVDALGPIPGKKDKDGLEDYYTRLRRLDDRDYVIDIPVCNMYVRACNFNLEELLFYAELFILDTFKDPDPHLVPGFFEDFAGTNAHARTIAAITGKLATEGENYRN
jgi:hypothetical protein